jgi:hypothetical protein
MEQPPFDTAQNLSEYLVRQFNSLFNTKKIPGSIKLTDPGSPTTGSGQIYLNGTPSNRIDFGTAGAGLPTFNTRSPGTKICLYPSLNATNVDFSMGIASATFWQSVGASTNRFEWYAGITNIATISGLGVFTCTGAINVGGNLYFNNLADSSDIFVQSARRVATESVGSRVIYYAGGATVGSI